MAKYVVGEEQMVDTLQEVAELLGVDKIKMADIKEGGQYADIVRFADDEDAKEFGEEGEGTEPTGKEDGTLTDTEGEDATPGDKEDDASTEEGKEDEADIDDSEDEDFEYNEPDRGNQEDSDDEQQLSAEDFADIQFESLDELKEFIRDLDDDTLRTWANGLAVEWNPTDHKSIERMRIAMAVHGYYFPELVKPKSESKKKKAKYGDFDTKELFKMAKENGVRVKRSGNEPIDRMRVIMALKKSGHLAE